MCDAWSGVVIQDGNYGFRILRHPEDPDCHCHTGIARANNLGDVENLWCRSAVRVEIPFTGTLEEFKVDEWDSIPGWFEDRRNDIEAECRRMAESWVAERVKNGEYKQTSYYPNGQKAYEYNYKDGDLHGKYLGWFSNGQPAYECNFKYGYEHGKFIGWYSNGQPDYEHNFKNGKKHGKHLGWFDNGQPEYEDNFKNGYLHGKCLGWYLDGQPRCERNFKSGKLHGKYLGWHPDGQPEYEWNFKDGKLVS